MHPYAVNDPAAGITRPETTHQPVGLPVRRHRTRPGPEKHDISIMLKPAATSPRDARNASRRALKIWGLANLIEATDAIISELVTNAVTASCEKVPLGRAPSSIVLRLSVEADWRELCVRVWDPDPAQPPRGKPLPDGDTENGRGLFIVDAISERWGWYPASNGGKYVWSVIKADAKTP
jgi:anti-sigma regulatory factor (Ser/Thr protein kinase)